MATWAVGMMKDEGDIAYHSVMHLGREVDGILVADNNSTDHTCDELSFAQKKLKGHCEVVIVDDPVVAYQQREKMTALAAQAAERGAEWIVPWDADEIWYAHRDTLANVLGSSPGVDVVTVPLWNHFPSAIDPPGDNPFKTIVWRQNAPGEFPKVAFRWRPDAVIQQGNHSVVFPNAEPGEIVDRPLDLEIRHFPYRSAVQFVRKACNGAAAYAATDLPVTDGAHWRQYGEILERCGEEALEDVFRQWYYFPAPVEAGMVLDPAPFRRWE